jgi:translocation and assembly module TamB
VVLALVLLAGLQTGPGLSAAADLTARLVSAATGLTVRLEDVSGPLPVSCAVGRLAVADAKGVWLVVKDLRLAWSPLALLRGRVHVDTLSADIIRVRRQPELPPVPGQPPQIEWPPRFPSLPPILVDQLAVTRLILDKELAGQDAVLGIAGRLAESGQGAVAASLAVTRQGGPPLTLRLAGSLNYADWRLAVKAKLADGPGGLLASALAGPEGGPLAVDLTGDGPLTAWRGRLDALLADHRFLTADLGLAVPLDTSATAAWTLDAGFTPPAGPPPAWAAGLARIVGERLSLEAAGRFGIVSGAVFLDRTTIQAALGQVTAEASLRPDTDALSAKLDLTLPDAGRLEPGLAGAVSASLTASGRLVRPELALRLSAKGFRAGPVDLAAAELTAQAVPGGDLDGAFPGAAVTAQGTLTGLAGPDGTTLLGRDLTLALAAGIGPSGALSARDCTLTGQDGALRLSGDLAADGALAARLGLTARDVAGAASLGGLALAGRAEATAEVSRDAAGAGQASLTVRLADLAATAATAASTGLAGLLGPGPNLAAHLEMTGARTRLSALSLEGRGVRLAGSGERDAASGRMAARLTADVPDLAPLGTALGQAVAGALHLEAELGGPAGTPELTTRTQARGLRFGETRLEHVDLEASAKDLARAPAGRLRLTAQRDRETAVLETGFAVSGQSLTLSDLRLTAPDTSLTAKAGLDMAKGTVSGSLSAASSDLSGLGRFVGLPLSGSLKLTASAAPDRLGQGLSAQVAAGNLRLSGLSVRELSLSADLGDLLGLPRGKASLAAKDLASGGVSLAQFKLAATGDGRALDLTCDTNGRLPGGQALTLATGARLTDSGKRRELRVASLAGSLDRHPFALQGPATVSFAQGTLGLDSLVLTLEGARLSASGRLTPSTVEGKASLSRLPLPLLAGFGLTGIDGTAVADLALSGSPAHPRLSAQARLEGLKAMAAKGRGLPAMAVTATAALEGQTLSATATLAQAGKKEMLSATVSLPARFSLLPLVLDLPQGGALSGRLTAGGDLTDVAALLAQANTRIVGKLAADLSLAGTLAAPEVNGSLGLEASRLENADTGLVLRDVVVRLEASGGVLTVAKATGQDLKGGSFTITGSLGPFAAGDAPVNLTTRLAHLKVAGLDLVSATADGSIALSGSLAKLAARGSLVIGPAEVNLPTSLPPSVVVIPVTDVNDPQAAPTAKKAAPPAVARRVDLDLAVTLGQAVYVRGLGMESRWGGGVTISGTADAPQAKGRLFVEQGRVDLFGGNLDITKGEVLFDGQSLLAPRLHILATNTTDDITAGVSLTGDATSPTIALVSQPPLPDNEILARILFGQSASSLSPLQAAQLAQAAASLYAGGGPTSILARTRRILGLDQLAIVPGKGNLQSTVLRASKEIVKGVTVGVEQGMGAQSGAVSVEVKITPNITVDSRVGADNKQGVGVNWKWDY